MSMIQPFSGRENYEEAWRRLVEIVDRRNRLLSELQQLVSVAAGSHPAEGYLVTLDAERAKALIDEIDSLRPRLDAALAQLNETGAAIGKAPVEWRDLALRK